MNSGRAQRSATRNMRTDASRPGLPLAGPQTAADQAKALGTSQGMGELNPNPVQTDATAQAPAQSLPDWYDMPSWMRTQILAGMTERG